MEIFIMYPAPSADFICVCYTESEANFVSDCLKKCGQDNYIQPR